MPASRSTSISSSSVVTVKRSASLSLRDRDAAEPIGQGNINRWSQSTASSRSSQKAQRSPTSSPRRRPRSPAHDLASAAPSLPPMLLPSTVYNPNTPPSASTNNTPPTADLFASGLFAGGPPRDYFNSKPQSPPPGSRPASRNKAERVLGKSPLGSPAIVGAQDGDARHDTTAGVPRPLTARRPSRESSQKPPLSAGHKYAAPRDHSRSLSKDQPRTGSRDHSRSASRDHHRSESNTSARLDDNYHDTPPRTRERREKDKKTMLSRALQKANTAVLLDNAQNFEGAMEAYEDACKLLQQVMIRSSQEEDRRKLDAIVSCCSPASQIFTNGSSA
jgi:hypothetical protein